MCQVNGTYLNVTHNYNPEDYTEIMDSSNAKLGFTSTNVSLNNGYLTCKITRKKALSGNAKYFDITNTPYYILTATGQNDATSKFCSDFKIKY